jgi:hypothetical protein
MTRLMFWLYLLNTVMLVIHEMDSAYWHEWELLHLPGGVDCFLILHLPLLIPVLYGLVLVERDTLAGQIFSLAVNLTGLFAFSLHTYFIRRGHREFTTRVSLGILLITLGVSLAQLVVTLPTLASM